MLQKPIFLVGPMGAGKSTVGKALAKALQGYFFDLDEIIVEKAQMSIPDIFKLHGEPYFRDFEHQCLAYSLLHLVDLTAQANCTEIISACCADSSYAQRIVVIAGGGGVAAREDNRQLIKRHSNCIYLHAPVLVQYERVKGDSNRPMIQADDVVERLQQLFNLRDPWFKEVSKFVLDATQPVDQVVLSALKHLEGQN